MLEEKDHESGLMIMSHFEKLANNTSGVSKEVKVNYIISVANMKSFN